MLPHAGFELKSSSSPKYTLFSNRTHICLMKSLIIMFPVCSIWFQDPILDMFSSNPGSLSHNMLTHWKNACHFTDAIFKCIFLNENIWISVNISLKFVPGCQINNIPALVQIMAWRRPGDKPLSEPMIFSLLTHICVTRPEWVNTEEQWQSRTVEPE